MQKREFRKIEVNELPKKIPNYKKSSESKDALVYKWLKEWIFEGLKSKKLQYNELLPAKADLAYHLGVSIGTVQNAIRYIEDEGYLVSKQRIGTLIKDVSSTENRFRKLTSKREKVILELKKMIVENDYQIGDYLPSARELSELLGSCSNTTRLALENLSSNGIIKATQSKGMESMWRVTSIPELSKTEKGFDTGIQTETLVSKVEEDLKQHICQNYKIGQKMCPHSELSKILGVSIKTVHDAMKSLIDNGYLLAHRGRYGTTVVKLPQKNVESKNSENTTQVEKNVAFYNYQKMENYIKKLIREKYKVGDKLPSMEVLSKELKVSTNTIKKALQNLYEQGCVDFSRGRYGGTFIVDIPEDVSDSAFKWLAVNPQYVKVYKD